MKKENQKYFFIALLLIFAFVLWTILICFVDVRKIGPKESEVGFALVNGFFHNLTGINMRLYIITDWLSLIPFCFIIGFALLGLIQWIKHKSIKKVDYSIFILGGFYIVVMALFILFEILVINYRPVLINGILEASYPSSTTMLVMCVMPTSLMQLNNRIHNKALKKCIAFLIITFTAFMVIGRLISGVHWLTDIIGGALLSAGLITMYYYVSNLQCFYQ
ncbi:MAG: phosphatase PAP2 family protein [Ruminococcaceae bacterium]|nr:phosphatase PAP2 family protein [Oscillospiraceae bacterium]